MLALAYAALRMRSVRSKASYIVVQLKARCITTFTLISDANAVLRLAFTRQRFKLIPGRTVVLDSGLKGMRI